jgi:hypothetical protein
VTGPLSAQSPGQEGTIRDEKQLLESLRSGGYVIVVRHGATFSDQADTDPFNFDDIAKQRNLNEKGKELAKAFGDAIRQVGIPAGEVYTSKFNRAFETAVLAEFKDVEKTTDLTEGGLVVSPDENSRRAAALRKMLAQMPETGKNTLDFCTFALERRRREATCSASCPPQGRPPTARFRTIQIPLRNCRRGSFILNLPSHHSITSSARARSVGGMVRLRARAILRLITSSNLVG